MGSPSTSGTDVYRYIDKVGSYAHGTVEGTKMSCLGLLKLIAFVCLLSENINGQCIMGEQSYQDGMDWQESPCETCTCEGIVPVCHTQRCNMTQPCDKTSILMLHSECCPVCQPKPMDCRYHGNTFLHGSQWSPKACTTCTCQNGRTSCATRTCAAHTSCQVQSLLHDPCCPSACDRGQQGVCSVGGGRTYGYGAVWSPSPCSRCICHDGFTQCFTQQCMQLHCDPNEEAEIMEGECCPRCKKNTCNDGTKKYESGEHWKRDRCTQCVCSDGHIECKRQTCDKEKTCHKGYHTEWRADECCPLCVPDEGGCHDGVQRRYDTELWRGTHCQMCACHQGEVTCHKLQCDTCQSPDLESKDPCCPECTAQAKCEVNGVTYQNGTSWMSSACSHCLCLGGAVSCYSMLCSVCPTGMYRQPISSQQCCAPCVKMVCFPDCMECTAEHPDVCTACKAGTLLQEGRCVTQCQAGYFSYKHMCQRCSSDCGDCTGPSPHQCTSCPLALFLEAGTCVQSCSVGYFLSASSCLPCSRDCAECKAAAQCLTCLYPWQLLQDGACTDQCRRGYYQELDRCKSCDERHCVACIKDDGGRCTGCPPGLLLQDNAICVAQCNQKLYYQNHICKPCVRHCLWCISGTSCQQCDSRSYLLRGRCVTDCGPGHSKDKHTRTCAENTAIPHLSPHSFINVTSDLTIITPAMIIASDDDTSQDQLILVVITAPSSGELLRIDGGQEHIMKAQSRFSMQNIRDGRIMFRKLSAGVTSDSIEVWLSDGAHSAPRQQIPIVSSSTEVADNAQLMLSSHAPLMLTRGGQADIGTRVLDVTGGTHVRFNILHGPSSGRIVGHSGRPVQSFSLAELRGSTLSYTHIGETDVTDHILVQAVSDNNMVINVLVSVIVQSQPSVTLQRVLPLYVLPGRQILLTTENLQASAPQRPITYALRQKPQYGRFVRLDGSNSPILQFTQADIDAGVISYQHEANHTQPDCFNLTVSVTLMQRFCVYVSRASVKYTKTYSYSIKQKAGGNGGSMKGANVQAEAGNVHMSGHQNVWTQGQRKVRDGQEVWTQGQDVWTQGQKSVEDMQEVWTLDTQQRNREEQGKQQDEDKDWTTTKDSSMETWTQAGGSYYMRGDSTMDMSYSNELLQRAASDQMLTTVTMPPTLKMGVVVHGVAPTLITNSELSLEVADTEPRYVQYRLSRPLGPRAGTIQVLSASGDSQDDSQGRDVVFTQEDVDERRVIYHPPAFSRKREIHLKLKVTDEKHKMKFADGDFYLWLVPADNSPPVLAAPVAKVMVPQGGLVVLAGDVIALHDMLTTKWTPEQLMLEIKELPFAGRLLRGNGGGGDVREDIQQGDVISYRSILQGELLYAHDGTNTLQDGLHLTLMTPDQEQEELELQIMVVRGDFLPPKRDRSAAWRITMAEGMTETVWRRHLMFSDPDTSSAAIVLRLATDTQYGTLTRGGHTLTAGDMLTQDDVNRGNAQYIAGATASDKPIAEYIFFNVSDAGGNMLAWQPFTVNIIPEDYKGPLLTIDDQMEVDEGDGGYLRPYLIDVRGNDGNYPDPDTLIITVQEQPKYGHIYNHRIEKSVNSFTLADLEDSHIEYVQSVTKGVEPSVDTLTLSATDGIHISPTETLTILIQSVNDEAPVVSAEPLQVEPQSHAIVDNHTVFVTDPDSPPHEIAFTVTQLPQQGELKKRQSRTQDVMEAQVLPYGGKFTYQDILDDQIVYQHGPHSRVKEPDTVLFIITDGKFEERLQLLVVIGNPITAVSDNKMTVHRGGTTIIPASILFYVSAVHEDIMYTLTALPSIGELQLVDDSEHTHIRLQSDDVFSQEMLEQGRVQYSTSEDDGGVAVIEFMVTDGRDNRLPNQTLEIIVDDILLPDDLPVITVNKPLVLEPWQTKTITHNHLKVNDKNSQNHSLEFSITRPPQKGLLQVGDNPSSSHFSMEDIYTGKVAYRHTGKRHSGTSAFGDEEEEEEGEMMTSTRMTSVERTADEDRFEFIVMDENSNGFVNGKHGATHKPVPFLIEIVHQAGAPSKPILDHNVGVDELQMEDGKAYATITKSSLFSKDDDTPPERIVYEIVREPKHGILMNKKFPTAPMLFFTQEDVNSESIRYVLTGNTSALHDSFEFDLLDSRPNILNSNEFVINWSAVQFSKDKVEVSEDQGVVRVPVDRKGNLQKKCSVTCSSQDKRAHSASIDDPLSDADYITYSERLKFDEGESRKTCNVPLKDDQKYEGPEDFDLQLSDPTNAVLGDMPMAEVTIVDTEDDPAHKKGIAVSFTSPVYTFVLPDVVTLTVMRAGRDLDIYTHAECVAVNNATVILQNHQQAIVFAPKQEKQGCSFNMSSVSVSLPLSFSVSLHAPTVKVLYPHTATVTIDKRETHPSRNVSIVEFSNRTYSVDEEKKRVSVVVERSGDTTRTATVMCFTHDNSAKSGIDFKERKNKKRTSKIKFRPGETSKKCVIELIDDDAFEMDELLYVRLALHKDTQRTQLGMKDSLPITITDSSDIPQLTFQHSNYAVREPVASGSTEEARLTVMRQGDTSSEAQVTWATTENTAIAGIDFIPNTSTIIFKPGSTSEEVSVIILNNPSLTGRAVVFSVHLSSPHRAALLPPTAATVTIQDNDVPTALVWPAPPVITTLNMVSALQDKPLDKADGPTQMLPSGQPLVCVTPCDPMYPGYASTGPICDKAGMNQSAANFRWEVAMPADHNNRMPFEEITDETCFTNVQDPILDSVYFKPHFSVRCVSVPVADGQLGVPLHSPPVQISSSEGVCRGKVQSGRPWGYQAAAFSTRLQYVEPTAKHHPNTLHISVHIPHQDGMMPIISTLPIHNLRLLLAPDPTYRTHHLCSNLIFNHSNQHSFLDQSAILQHDQPATDFNMPEQTQTLYKHLDQEQCTWHFNAWYHMTELVDICKGSVISDFEVRDSAQSYLTVRVPLYVSYLYTKAPRGWTQIDHSTSIESAFFYSTVHWKAAHARKDGKVGRAKDKYGGDLQLLKISTGEDGKLVMDFRTQAHFRGKFVLEDVTNSSAARGRVVAPADLPVTFDLVEVWGQETTDSPVQVWRAVSEYTLKDYSGDFVIELLPCVSSISSNNLQCVVHGKPTKFTLPLVYEQTVRPVPLSYSLGTQFDLSRPIAETAASASQLDGGHLLELPTQDQHIYKPGDEVAGYVSWDPDQSLNTSFRLLVEKVYICTGSAGYIPTFDPTGSTYNEGPQYGCLEPRNNLKHSLLILDRGDMDSTTSSLNGVDFDARFVNGGPDTGRDGFTFNVDPLYKSSAGYSWFVQVIFVIGPANRVLHDRYQRDITSVQNKQQNGTNIKVIELDRTLFSPLSAQGESVVSKVLPVVFMVVALLVVVLCLGCFRNRSKGSVIMKECVCGGMHAGSGDAGADGGMVGGTPTTGQPETQRTTTVTTTVNCREQKREERRQTERGTEV